MTTLTVMFAIGFGVALGMLVYDKWEQRQKRRDREIVRRIQTYLAQLPPSRPW